jgi:hypothetical protein
MMKSVFNLELDGLIGDFLVRLKHECKKENDRVNYRSNVDNRKDLEQRVSNDDILDTADEATLSKLMAAHEIKNRYDRGRKRSNVDNRKDLEQRVSNGDKLDTADEATLSKLSAAHESKKSMIVIIINTG